MQKCRRCKQKMCVHPLVRYEHGKKICNVCNKEAVHRYAKMTIDGKIDPDSNTLGLVCDECYKNNNRAHQTQPGARGGLYPEPVKLILPGENPEALEHLVPSPTIIRKGWVTRDDPESTPNLDATNTNTSVAKEMYHEVGRNPQAFKK